MNRVVDAEIDRLKNELLSMKTVAESALTAAFRAEQEKAYWQREYTKLKGTVDFMTCDLKYIRGDSP